VSHFVARDSSPSHSLLQRIKLFLEFVKVATMDNVTSNYELSSNSVMPVHDLRHTTLWLTNTAFFQYRDVVGPILLPTSTLFQYQREHLQSALFRLVLVACDQNLLTCIGRLVTAASGWPPRQLNIHNRICLVNFELGLFRICLAAFAVSDAGRCRWALLGTGACRSRSWHVCVRLM
jgi:hypothetical protein